MPTPTRLAKISEIFEKLGQPKYRFAQINDAIYKSSFTRFSQITNLPKELREQIIKEIGDEILTLKLVSEVKGDSAHKVLFHTVDNKPLESVVLYYQDRTALCVSTQSGCALGCAFCATGKLGLLKNISADEIVDQYLYFQKQGIKIDSLIFMGMGEPFANPDATFQAISNLTNPKLIGLGQRRLSISTVGIIPGIERLTREYPQINLAFSLHSPFNDQRQSLMPINAAYPIDKVMAAIDQHLQHNNHKVFISYILLKNVNDSPEHAQALVDLINATPDRRRLLHVNLIRYNPTNDPNFQKSSPDSIKLFHGILTRNNINNTLRQDFGVAINAACGQLAANGPKIFAS